MWFINREEKPEKENYDNEKIATPNKFPVLPKEPGVYRLVKYKNELEIVYESNIFKTSDLVFGDVKKRVLREWARFCRYAEPVGSLNVGDQGSGKSNKCDILANIAILKGNMPVLIIHSLTITEQELQFLNTLNNCCIYLDEFGKTTPHHIQQKMLSLLTNTSKKFLILFTENNKSQINNFMLDRTQRIRYLEEFGKLSKQAVLDFLSLYEVKESFKEELLIRYDKALTFSIDHLKGIISEHLDYPEDTLDEVLSYLNISVLSKKLNWVLVKLEKKSIGKDENGNDNPDIKEYKEIPTTECRDSIITLDSVKSGYGTSIENYWIRLDKENVISHNGGILILESGNFRLTYKEE